MARREQLGRPTPEGGAMVDITLGVVKNVLDAIDQGTTTQQIRESIMRIEKSEAVVPDDTRLFVLGLSWQKPRDESI